MLTNKNAQGTIEYLILISIVVVIALVVVGLLLQIMDNGSGIPQTAAQTAWKSEQPWAIVDWSKTDTTLTLVIKNNGVETMDFGGIYLTSGDKNNTGTSSVTAGTQITKTISGLTSCNPGTKYSYPKSGIYIDFNSLTLTGRRQVASADIIGTCS
ncbi:MAG: hypothetical protein WCI04_04640 [archaeon]